jgi:hypothetical protein
MDLSISLQLDPLTTCWSSHFSTGGGSRDATRLVGTRHTRKGTQDKKSKVDVKYVDVYNDQLENKTGKKRGGHLASIREKAA